MLKTIGCGELRREHDGQEVTLAGWVDRRRDHGNLIFVDLRDRSGIVQTVFNPGVNPRTHESAGQVRGEWVIQVSGRVKLRWEESVNDSIPTGEVEVAVESMTVLNEAKTPPFYVNDESGVDELLRLKYRYLDLRRPRMRDMLIMRHNAVKFIRDFLSDRGFLDIETPILIKSTPEGARDYLVPSRLYPGKFYSLPQSPQQLKQLLMAAGVERYFQMARCFRDEDPRGDRQPEFTQLDLEMSFVDEDDVLDLIERLYTEMFEALVPGRRIMRKPFPRISYADAMRKYASDRPDLRYGLEMADFSDAVRDTEFRVVRSALAAGGIVKGFAAPGLADMPRRQLDDLVEFAKGSGAQGLIYIALSGDASSRRPDRRECQVAGVQVSAAFRREGDGAHGGGESRRSAAGHRRSREVDERRLGRAPEGNGAASRSRGSERPRVCVRRGFPLVRVGRRGAAMELVASPIHRAKGWTRGPLGDGSGRGSIARIRSGVQRIGGRGGEHSHPPASIAEQDIRGTRLHGGGDPVALQATARSVRVRDAAARRHRCGHRAAHHAAAKRR